MLVSRHKLFGEHSAWNFPLLLVVLFVHWTCQDTRGIEARPVKKVVGGIPAPIGRFPYMCSLRRRGNREHVCGGTIMESRWVLTAAHCVESQYAGMSPILYCGIYERDERNSSKVFAVDRTVIHPQWNGNISKGYDIALIQLDRESDTALPDLVTQGSLYTSGNVFSALGWGVSSSGGFTDLLQIAPRLPFVARRICNRDNYWSGQIMESMICAGIGEQDTQQGDSGGPLLQLDFPDGDYTLGESSYDLVVGITSFGEDSGGPFKPGVYTSISYFRDWIDCVVEDKEDCLSGRQGTTASANDAEKASSTSDVNTIVVAQASLSPVSFEHSFVSPEPPTESFDVSLEQAMEPFDVSPELEMERFDVFSESYTERPSISPGSWGEPPIDPREEWIRSCEEFMAYFNTSFPCDNALQVQDIDPDTVQSVRVIK